VTAFDYFDTSSLFEFSNDGQMKRPFESAAVDELRDELGEALLVVGRHGAQRNPGPPQCGRKARIALRSIRATCGLKIKSA
jgi:hypothetical protein